jgi:hypothetical protein
MIHLSYGRTGLNVDLPADLDAQILHLTPLPVLQDETRAIREAYRNPIGSPPLWHWRAENAMRAS